MNIEEKIELIQPKTTSTSVEQYQCQSYYDDEGTLQDCTCGKCGKQTTSTDIEEKELVSLNIKIATKDLVKRVDAIIPEMDLHSKISLRGKIIRLIAEELAPHLSNKSELKKEAVRGFAKWLDLDTEAVYKMPHFMQEWAEEYLSSNEKEESEGQDDNK